MQSVEKREELVTQIASHRTTGDMDAMAGGSTFGRKGISLEKDTSATFGEPTLSPNPTVGQMKLEVLLPSMVKNPVFESG